MTIHYYFNPHVNYISCYFSCQSISIFFSHYFLLKEETDFSKIGNSTKIYKKQR